MLAVLLWALIALGLVVAVLLALLAFPVRVRFEARSGPGGQVRVELGLLGGLVPWIALFDSARPGKSRTAGPEAKKPRKKKKPGRAGRMSGRRVLRAGPGLVGGVLRQIRLERLHVAARFGLGDPAETGRLFGMLAPIAYAPQWLGSKAVSVVLTPVFEVRCLSGAAEGALAVTPIRLLPPGLVFVWRVFGPGR